MSDFLETKEFLFASYDSGIIPFNLNLWCKYVFICQSNILSVPRQPHQINSAKQTDSGSGIVFD